MFHFILIAKTVLKLYIFFFNIKGNQEEGIFRKGATQSRVALLLQELRAGNSTKVVHYITRQFYVCKIALCVQDSFINTRQQYEYKTAL